MSKSYIVLLVALVCAAFSGASTQPATIAATAIATADLSTLVAALTAADLVDTFQGPGPFTVFAPTNAAFAKLPAADLAALLADKAALTKVLTYHVVSGAVPASAVVAMNSATTLEGSDVAIAVMNGNVMLNTDSTVIATDIMASNGIVHLIDTVLMPPAPKPTIVATAIATADLSTLVAALTAADLVDTFQGPGPFTVFAPTNAAFAKLPAADLAALLADKAALTKVLTYHVVSGAVSASAVVTMSSATTLEGSDVAIAVMNGNVMLNTDSTVIATDIMASNGIVHLIDTVLMPPAAGDVDGLANVDADGSILSSGIRAAPVAVLTLLAALVAIAL